MNGELFLRIFQHLLPKSEALKITIDKDLRRFFVGLSNAAADARVFLDDIYNDMFPQYTRKLPEWEQQFNLPNSVTVEQERRDRLEATWKATGGQSPRYIEDTLRGAGFDVYVHESFDTKIPPVYKDPTLVLQDGTSQPFFVSRSGDEEMRAGAPEARAGNRATLVGFAITNITSTETPVFPTLPTDPLLWPYFIYIGGQTYPEPATVVPARQQEFLDLCLKICPTHLWIGLIVQFA